METNPTQLFLLADHLKLSLLERQRAQSLSLPATKQDSHISRSLDTLRDGITSLSSQQFDREAAGEDTTDLSDQIARLQSQLTDLESDFRSSANAPSTPSVTTKTPNDPSLSPDFTAAQSRPSRPQAPRSSSLRKAQKSPGSKAVRFRDDPSAEEPGYRDDEREQADEASRSALFSSRGYSDDPSDGSMAGGEGGAEMDNQQIHAYHKRVMAEQDEQLDTLGLSVRRQRDLSMQMGDELDDQAVLLEDVESGVDRHQGSLDRARGRLGKIERKARENWSWVTIGVLILILVLLIVLLK